MKRITQEPDGWPIIPAPEDQEPMPGRRRKAALLAAVIAAPIVLSSCGHGCSVGCWWPGC